MTYMLDPFPSGTRIRVHKGVRPYGGRILDGYARSIYTDDDTGEVKVTIEAFGKADTGFFKNDIRGYDPSEVDIIYPKDDESFYAENGYEVTNSEISHKDSCDTFRSSGNRCTCGALEEANG